MQDLVALLSGRNFETKQYEEVIAEHSFGALKSGVLDFVNKTHFDRITMILRSAGLVTNDLIGGQNAVNFAYILYLRGRAEGLASADLERLVRRWYAMSALRGRYAGSPETAFDVDIRQIDAQGLVKYVETVVASELPGTFWTGMLPQLMDTSSSTISDVRLTGLFCQLQAFTRISMKLLGFGQHHSDTLPRPITHDARQSCET